SVAPCANVHEYDPEVPPPESDPYLRTYKCIWHTLYAANMGMLEVSKNIPGLSPSGVHFPSVFRRRMSHQIEEWVRRALKNTRGHTHWIRQAEDAIRLAVSHAVSRRFTGTVDRHGVIDIDEQAVDYALDHTLHHISFRT